MSFGGSAVGVAAAVAVALWSSSSVPGLEVVPVVDATLAPVVTAEVDNAWAAMHGVVPSTASSTAAPSSTFRLTVRPAFALPPNVLASSQPGTIELRLSPSTAGAPPAGAPPASSGGGLDLTTRLALRHEVVHQFLWRHCAPATRDRLFHEAVAVALSGEASMWRDAGYLSVPDAARALVGALERRDLDTPVARRALARLVTEGGGGPAGSTLPRALQEGLARCVDDAPWQPLTVEVLAGGDHVDVRDALIVLHAVTGEVLEASGAVDHAQPFGSTLKPFLVAAASSLGRPLPTLPSRPADPQWACGEETPARVDVAAALQRSCNGWFLDLEARQGPSSVDLGPVGEVLVALGLNRLPTDMSEAIGIRASLTMSARGLAEAFRALAASSPPSTVDAIAALRVRGTLKDVPRVAGLAGMAAKTGTVRDLHSRPILGLLVAVDDELVIVRARTGVQARALVDDVVEARTRHRGREQQRVSVQVFGLLPEHAVEARCDGVALTVTDGAPRLATSTSLSTLVGGGGALCARGSWRVTPGAEIAERPYAGVFVRSPAPPPPRGSSTSDPTVTPRQRAARRGADVVFVTSRARYTDAVLDAEDASLRGEAKVALARVIDHNVDHGDARHPGRPVCDTTHCQTFKGTRPGKIDGAVVAAVRRPLSATGRTGWLPFSQGGSAPWQQERTDAAVRTAMGPLTTLTVQGDVAVVVRPVTGAGGDSDEPEAVPCELLRSRLRLPSCPSTVARRGATWVFAGQGAGHGLGLDVERAKAEAAAGASADTILGEAYPPVPGAAGATRSTTRGR